MKRIAVRRTLWNFANENSKFPRPEACLQTGTRWPLAEQDVPI